MGQRLRKHNVGCPCCDDVCKIDRLTAETEVTQDAIRDAEHPQAPYPSWLQAEVRVGAGAKAVLFLAWDDATPGDGLYLEFAPESTPDLATLKIFRKGGAQIGDTLRVGCGEPDTWHRITACYDPEAERITACVDVGNLGTDAYHRQCVHADLPNDFAAGRQAGYGRAGSGDVAIRNYRYDRLWYYGTTGMETLCCKPSIATTQTGRYPGSGPVACFDLSAITSPLQVWDLAVMLPDGSFITVSFYGPYSAQDVASQIYTAVANAGYPNAGFGNVTTNGSVICIEVGGDFAGEAIPTNDYPYAAIAVYDGEITSAGYTPGTADGLNARQTITLGRQRPCPFFLAFEDEQTVELSEESSATDIQAALESLTPIGTGNVTVTGDVGGPFMVEFVGTLAVQPIGQIVAISAVDDCLDCVLEQEYYGYGYYGDVCTRTYCHRCGSPSCTVVDEDFSDIEGDETTPGDMPCGWDASGTDWGVIDGAATGNGTVCHKFDTTGGSYIITATFGLGHLETQGDTLTVTLSYGDIDHSVIVTRIAGPSSGDPDVFKYTFSPSGMGVLVFDDEQASVSMRICDGHVWNDIANTRLTATKTTEGVCVSITQPTYSGFSNATLTALAITKDYGMDPDCPCCTDTCYEGQSAALDTEYNWSLSSGTMVNGVIASPGATATWNHQLPERAWEAYSLAIRFDSTWSDLTATIGDSIVFTSPGILATIAVTQVTPSLVLTLSLSGTTGGDSSETISGTFTSIGICVENGTAVVTLTSVYGTAAVVYGTVSSTPVDGVVSIAVNSPHDFTLVSLLARYTGTIINERCVSEDCGRCSPPCDICIDDEGITGLAVELDWGPITNEDYASVANPEGTWRPMSSQRRDLMTFNLYSDFVIPLSTISGSFNCRIEGGFTALSSAMPYGDKCVRVSQAWEGQTIYKDTVVRYGMVAAFTNNLSLTTAPWLGLLSTYACYPLSGMQLTGIATPAGHYLVLCLQTIAYSTGYTDFSVPASCLSSAFGDGNARAWTIWIKHLGTTPIDCNQTITGLSLYAADQAYFDGQYFYESPGMYWKPQGIPRSITCRGI